MKNLKDIFFLIWMVICLPLLSYPNSVLTISHIKNKYPQAQIVQVSSNEYSNLLQSARQSRLKPIIIASAESKAHADTSKNNPPQINCDSLLKIDTLSILPIQCSATDSDSNNNNGVLIIGDESLAEPQEVEPDAVSEGYINTFGQFISDLGSNSKSGDDYKWAVVIMVVIGTVVVAGFIVLGGKILYDLIVNKKKYPLWRDFSLLYTYSTHRVGDAAGPRHTENVHFLSARFALGWQRPQTGVGIGVETGYLDINIKRASDAGDIFDINGYFLLFGPTIRFGRHNPFALNLSFYNGTANRSSIGLISKSRADFEFRLRGPLYLGVHFGALYTDIDYSDGFLFKDWALNSEFTILYGIHFGYDF